MENKSRAPSALRRWLRWGSARFLDTLYPPACFGCPAPLPATVNREGPPEAGRWLCRSCQDKLPLIEPPVCRVCGEPFSGALPHAFQCLNCDGRVLDFDFATSAYRAQGLMRDWIHQFKYQRRHELRGLLGALMRRALDDPRLAAIDPAAWLLVPVPMHPWRQMWREYNQSWELCLELSRVTGIPALNALRRTRHTSSQAGLDRAKRLRNLRGAITLRRSRPWHPPPDFAGRSILLVDDVLTTGSTCHECARVLRREGGAEKVVVITLARG